VGQRTGHVGAWVAVSRCRQPQDHIVKSLLNCRDEKPRRLGYDAVMTLPRFHLAFPVRDLTEARAFYGDLLGCPEGRSSDEWVDFNFHGHQIVAHLAPEELAKAGTNAVDGEEVPVRHFGAILTVVEWEAMAEKLRAAGQVFVIEPQIRFKGQAGEQATMFFLDPSGNALEFKAFADDAMVFAK
jgi:extradiol dioxygenase family protein